MCFLFPLLVAHWAMHTLVLLLRTVYAALLLRISALFGPILCPRISLASAHVRVGVERRGSDHCACMCMCVQVGEPVNKDDVVVILEAMKMETPITAPCSGHIAAVKAVQSQLAPAGALLIVIKPDAAQ